MANGPYGTAGANASLTYTYDELGNLTFNSQVGTYTYPVSGSNSVRPHAVSTAGSNTYTYDANGNLTAGAGRTLTYNLENKPLTITIGSQTTTFVYDGDGGRVKKIAGTTTTRYISQLYECDNASCSRMIFAGGQRIATVGASGAVYYYHTDHLGSSSVITDSAGAKVQALTYFPYGAVRTNDSPTTPVIDVAYKYTSKELDSSTGLYDYGTRQYDPALARFISADPIQIPPGHVELLNRYTYVNNCPIKYIDPTGQLPTLPDVLIGASIGSIAGYTGNLTKGYTEQIIGTLAGAFVGGVVGAVSPSLSRVAAGQASTLAVSGWNAAGSYLQQVGTNVASTLYRGQTLDGYWALTSVNWYQVGGAFVFAPLSIIGAQINPAIAGVSGSPLLGRSVESLYSGLNQGVVDLGLSMAGGIFNKSNTTLPGFGGNNPIFDIKSDRELSAFIITGHSQPYGIQGYSVNLPGAPEYHSQSNGVGTQSSDLSGSGPGNSGGPWFAWPEW